MAIALSHGHVIKIWVLGSLLTLTNTGVLQLTPPAFLLPIYPFGTAAFPDSCVKAGAEVAAQGLQQLQPAAIIHEAFFLVTELQLTLLVSYPKTTAQSTSGHH